MNIKFSFGAAFVALLSSSVAFATSPPLEIGGYPGVTSTILESVTEKTYPYVASVWRERHSPESGKSETCIGIVHVLEDGVVAVEKLGYCGSVFSRIDGAFGVDGGEYRRFRLVIDGEDLAAVNAITTIYVRNHNVRTGTLISAFSKGKYKEYFANSETPRIPVDLISAYRTQVTQITAALDERLDELRGIMDQTALK